MKKILVISDYYLPGYKAGGPIKSVSTLCSNIDTVFDITVMTLNHDLGQTKPYENLPFDTKIKFDNHNVIYLSKLDYKLVYSHLKKVEPSIIYINSFFSKFSQIVLLLKKLKLTNARIIIAPRGELSKGALSIKKVKKSLFIKIAKLIGLYNHIIFHATDKIEYHDLEKIFKNKIYTIPNLASSANIDIKQMKKLKNELKLVFLSRISAKKNLLFALEVLKMIDKANIIFDIYGTQEDKNYWNKCANIMKNFKNIHVEYKGSLKPVEISETLSQYHAFFLPTLNENFGHAIVEAMQVGLIPIISDQTPWNDLEGNNAGWAISLNNKEQFINAINNVMDMNNEIFVNTSNNVKKYIGMKLDNNKSIEMYKSMFEKIITKDDDENYK